MFYLILLAAIILFLIKFKLKGEFLLKTCFVLFVISVPIYLVGLRDIAEIGMRVSFLFGIVGIIILSVF